MVRDGKCGCIKNVVEMYHEPLRQAEENPGRPF
jgi:hypothetical protein